MKAWISYYSVGKIELEKERKKKDFSFLSEIYYVNQVYEILYS